MLKIGDKICVVNFSDRQYDKNNGSTGEIVEVRMGSVYPYKCNIMSCVYDEYIIETLKESEIKVIKE